MQTSKKLISVILSLVLIFLSSFSTAYAENELFSSFNVQNYSTSRYGSIVSSQLVYENNNVIRAEIEENVVHIEVFDNNYNLKSALTVDGELEYICGVHFGKNANFIVCAQTNPQESDAREVVRIIKYSKSWQRIDSASIHGANTYIFADAGSLRFTEYGNYLYVRSCHEMYITADGKHHQANMTFVIDTSSMTITDDAYSISNSSNGYVSHSFNQFIATDEDTDSIIAVDHGDAHPRSIVMFRYDDQLGSSALAYPSNVTILSICGNSGDNITGVSVSDLIVTDNNYIVAFNSTPQDGISVTRNAYLAIVPKNSFRTESVRLIKLTDYSGKDNVVCGYPYITDMGNGKYSVIWEANKSTDTINNVYYTTIDENGNLLTNVKSFEAYLSDCEPVLINGKAVWYSTFDSEPVFYYVSTSGAGVECDKYEPVENKFQGAQWEYSEYFSDDSELTLTVDYTPDAVITSIKATSDTYRISYSSIGLVLKISTYNTAGTYYYYATLSDGKVIKKEIVVKDVAEKTTTPSGDGNHSFRKETILEATCTQAGNIKYECIKCGYDYEEEIPATGHSDPDANGLCNICNLIILTENPTAYMQWEKDAYYTEDEYATFNVICDEGVRIVSIYSNASSYTYSINSGTSINYYINGTAGTTKIYVKLSDGQLIGTELVVTDKNALPPETTTQAPETTTVPETTTQAPETTTKEPEITTEPTTTVNGKMGDLNDDGNITAADARTALRISAQLEIAPDNVLLLADTNNDDIITAADARKILRVSASLDTF